MFGMTFFAPPLRRFYALRWQGEGYVPDLDGAVEALERFSCSPFPTRIVGFPSYLWFGLKRMEELGISLRLRPGSKILLAGGWKQHWQQPGGQVSALLPGPAGAGGGGGGHP